LQLLPQLLQPRHGGSPASGSEMVSRRGRRGTAVAVAATRVGGGGGIGRQCVGGGGKLRHGGGTSRAGDAAHWVGLGLVRTDPGTGGGRGNEGIGTVRDGKVARKPWRRELIFEEF
jgi:hypothetical protein